MEIILNILKEYDGIIGAILGVIATLITTDWLQKRGNLCIYVSNWKDRYETYEDVGCSQRGKEETDFYGYGNEVELEIYNANSNPKIMRNIKIEYYNSSIKKYISILRDENSARMSSVNYMIRDNLEVINFNPKEVTKLKLSNYIHNDELNKVENCNKVYLTYNDEKNKKRKVLLYEGMITQKNYRKEGD